MSNAEALRILTRVWESRHQALREVLLSANTGEKPLCANCMKMQIAALSTETDALARALDVLRDTSEGRVR